MLSETFVAAEARELVRIGHPLRIRAASRGEGNASDLDLELWSGEGVGPARRSAALARALLRHPLRCAADLAARRRWGKEEHPAPLRRLAPDLVRLMAEPERRLHAHFAGPAALSAMRVSRILGRPWSLTAHAYDIYLSPRNLEEKLHSASLVTSGCDYTVEHLRRLAGPARAPRVDRIVMGVDPAHFVRRVPATERATILAVGRLVEKKGFIHLVRAAADPELAAVLDRLTIVGAGPLHDELSAEIALLGLEQKVFLVGPLESDGVREALEEAAVLAMPCVVARSGDRDSMPVVVKEALAMEVPVVVSDEVGLPEIARPEFARLVPPGDHRALAGALAELLALPAEERARMGRAGRRFVERKANLRTETARLSRLLEQLR